jgi:hypothetical protein
MASNNVNAKSKIIEVDSEVQSYELGNFITNDSNPNVENVVKPPKPQMAANSFKGKVKAFTSYEIGKIFIRYSWDLIVDIKKFEEITVKGVLNNG